MSEVDAVAYLQKSCRDFFLKYRVTEDGQSNLTGLVATLIASDGEEYSSVLLLPGNNVPPLEVFKLRVGDEAHVGVRQLTEDEAVEMMMGQFVDEDSGGAPTFGAVRVMQP
jgi:hypothetical protein